MRTLLGATILFLLFAVPSFGTLPSIVAVAGDDFGNEGTSFVLLSDGTVWAGGRGDEGQLGTAWDPQVPSPLGDPIYPALYEVQEMDWLVRVMADRPGVPFAGVVAIDAGAKHVLALKANGTVWAWGDNSCGQLGLGNPNDSNADARGPLGSTAPVQVLGLPPIRAIAAGSFHNLALDEEGYIWAWGCNNSGQCGVDGDPAHLWPAWQNLSLSSCWTPQRVRIDDNTLLSGIVAIAASKNGDCGPQGHSLAVDSGGNAWGWGWNEYGMSCDTTRNRLPLRCVPYAAQVRVDDSTNPPHYLTGVKTARGAIAAGGQHSLAVLSSGVVVAWGRNDCGQLGDGSAEEWTEFPVAVQDLTETVAVVGAGFSHSAARTAGGAMYTWGSNGSGQCGLGDPNLPGGGESSYDTAQLVPAPLPASNLVASGVGTTYSLGANGAGVWAWGSNEDGQLCNLSSDIDLPSNYSPAPVVYWAPAVLLTSNRDHITPPQSVTLTATVTPPPFCAAQVARYDWYANRDYQNAIYSVNTNLTTCQLLPPVQPTVTTEYAVKVTDSHGLWYMTSIVIHVGAYQGPTAAITSTMPAYIYEGWTVNLTATASDTDPGRTLTYAWTQTGGTRATLASETSLNASFVVPFKSLKSGGQAGYRDLEENLTFQFVATDDASPARSSAPVTTSVRCYICGDIDHDGAVILADLKLLVAAWNSTPTSGNWNLAADLDGSSTVILADLKLLVANWNSFDQDPQQPHGQSDLQTAAAPDGAVSDLDSLDPDTDLVNFRLVAVDPTTGLEVSSVRATTTQPIEVRLYGQCPTSGLWAVGGDIVADGPAGTLSSADQQFAWTTSPALPLWQWTGGAWTQVGTYPNSSMLEGNFAGSPPQVETTTETYNGTEHVTGYICTPATTGTCAGQISPATEANWYKGGVPGPNGGMTGLGSGQGITVTPDAGLGANSYVLLGSYTVSVLDDTQAVTLTWQEAEQDTWSICEYYGGWYTTGIQGLYTQIGEISTLKINWPSVTPGPVPPFVYEGWTVDLTATSSSSDPSLVYSWTQTGGRTVSDLTVDPATGNASFAVPTVELTTDVPLKFTVTVDDGHNHTASAEVTINTYIMGNITHDSTVNNDDIQALMAAWNSGPGYTGPADLDQDGYVNLSDLKFINPNWGRTLGNVAITITGKPDYTYEGRPVSLGCSIRSIHGDTPSYAWTQAAGTAVVDPSGADTASYSFTVPTLAYTSDIPLTFSLAVNAGQDGIATKVFQVAAYMLGDINHNNIVNNSGIGNDQTAMQTAMGTHPGDAHWNPAADFNGDGVIDSNDQNLVPSWNRTLTPPISLTVGDVPGFVYEGWPVSLSCTASSGYGYTLSYHWTQVAGPDVTISGVNTASASFDVPPLQTYDDEWLGFTVTVNDGHGHSITSDALWVDAYLMGDVNHDYSVDSNDEDVVTTAMDSTPSDSNWNAWADLNYNSLIDPNDMALVSSNLGHYLDFGMQGVSTGWNQSASVSDQQTNSSVAQPSTTDPVDSYGLTFEQALQQAGLLQDWLNYLNAQGQASQ